MYVGKHSIAFLREKGKWNYEALLKEWKQNFATKEYGIWEVFEWNAQNENDEDQYPIKLRVF